MNTKGECVDCAKEQAHACHETADCTPGYEQINSRSDGVTFCAGDDVILEKTGGNGKNIQVALAACFTKYKLT